MREVKFRIWDNPTNKMYFDVLVGNCNGENTCPCVFINEKGWVHTDNCIIEQFTGLHDKNGVEIYEGDIIKGKEWEHGNSHRHIGVVTYIGNAFRSVGINKYLGFHGSVDGSYEVIGNIHSKEN